MQLLVDFNMLDEDGTVPSLLKGEAARALRVGDRVTAVDGEGLIVQAEVTRISEDRELATVRPVGPYMDDPNATRAV